MNWFRRLWGWLLRPSKTVGVGVVFVAGGLAGVVVWGGFNTYVEYTNTMDFCLSCHEMREFAYEEYKQSAHFKNASGVGAVCSDCHVPKDWTAKMARKVQASNELFHKILGSISTREKFEAKRLELAENVWAKMMANDSRECRNCHSYESMDFHKQSRRAQEKMQEGLEKGKTCIECHKGVAHKLPADYEDDD